MTDGSSERTTWAYRAVQIGAIAPLIGFVVVYFAHPPLKAVVDEGVGLLASADLKGLRVWAKGLGPWAAAGTTVLMIVQALAAPIPAVLVTATNSWLFGWVVGGVLSILAATLAAVICYVLARTFGEPLVQRLVPRETLERGDAMIEKHGITAVLVARLVPFVPFDPISYVAGLSRMRLMDFTLATIVGQVPAGMTYSYLAQQVDKPSTLIVVAPSAFLGLVVLGLALRRALLGKDEEATTSEA